MKPLALVLPMIALVAFAQQRQGLVYSISEVAVANLLCANGANVASSQVHLPMQLTAASPNPHLEIVAAHRVTDHELDLEVRCQAASECLAFDALVDVKDANTTASAVHRGDSLQAPAPQSSLDAAIGKSSLPAGSVAATPDHLRAGTRAVLVLTDARMRIHIPVIAMDSGSKGSMIRVSTLDRKKIFHVLIVDGATVRGGIE